MTLKCRNILPKTEGLADVSYCMQQFHRLCYKTLKDWHIHKYTQPLTTLSVYDRLRTAQSNADNNHPNTAICFTDHTPSGTLDYYFLKPSSTPCHTLWLRTNCFSHNNITARHSRNILYHNRKILKVFIYTASHMKVRVRVS